MTTIAVMILVRLAIGRWLRSLRLHSPAPLRAFTRSPAAATIPADRPRVLALALAGLASKPKLRLVAIRVARTRRSAARMMIPVDAGDGCRNTPYSREARWSGHQPLGNGMPSA